MFKGKKMLCESAEYGMGGQACASGDVYSYGVLLLEMFTGRRPTEAMFREELTLARFVEAADGGGPGILSAVDPALPGNLIGYSRGHGRLPDQDTAVERCLISVMRIGTSCASELPVNRPGMKEVANEITKVRTSLLHVAHLVQQWEGDDAVTSTRVQFLARFSPDAMAPGLYL
jgi:hypothetical protein